MEKPEAIKMLLAISFFFIGVSIGILLEKIILHIKKSGTLRIDHSDPQDGPYLFLELEKGIHNISKRHCILLEVKLKNYYSHK